MFVQCLEDSKYYIILLNTIKPGGSYWSYTLLRYGVFSNNQQAYICGYLQAYVTHNRDQNQKSLGITS